MRLKEITPGMVIHCKNDEEMEVLLEDAEKLGYRWRGGYKISDYKKYNTGHTIHFYGPSSSTNYNYILWSNDTDGVTEFSDLIMPELTAEEAIKLNTELCASSCNKCPLYDVDGYRDCDDLCLNNPEKAVEILAKWKSNHEKKEPEIETVDICRIIEIQQDGRKRCVHEETIEKPITLEVEETLKRYCMEHEGEFIAVHEVVSRVKRYRP